MRTRARATASRSPSYLGKSDAFDRSLADFAAAYADLNEHDYNLVVEAVRDGRITVEEGV